MKVHLGAQLRTMSDLLSSLKGLGTNSNTARLTKVTAWMSLDISESKQA